MASSLRKSALFNTGPVFYTQNNTNGIQVMSFITIFSCKDCLYVKGLLMSRYMTSSSHGFNSVCRTDQGHLFYEGEKSQRCDPRGDTAGQSQPHSPAWAERGLKVQELPPHHTSCLPYWRLLSVVPPGTTVCASQLYFVRIIWFSLNTSYFHPLMALTEQMR